MLFQHRDPPFFKKYWQVLYKNSALIYKNSCTAIKTARRSQRAVIQTA